MPDNKNTENEKSPARLSLSEMKQCITEENFSFTTIEDLSEEEKENPLAGLSLSGIKQALETAQKAEASLSVLRGEYDGQMCLDKIKSSIYQNNPGVGIITSHEDIRYITEHILFESIGDIRKSLALGRVGSYYPFLSCHASDAKIYNFDEDATLLDVMVIKDWCSMNIRERENSYGREFWALFRDMAKIDPWFKHFMRISIPCLMDFLRSKDANITRKIPGIFNLPADDDEVQSYSPSIGRLLCDMDSVFKKAWNPNGENIAHYQKRIISSCKTVHSLVHAICVGYADIDSRVEFFRDYSSEEIKEALKNEKKLREEQAVFQRAI